MGFSSSDEDDGGSSSDDTADLTRRLLNNAKPNALKIGGDKRKKAELDEPSSSSPDDVPTATGALQQERKKVSVPQASHGSRRSVPIGGDDSSSNYSDSEDDRIAQKIAKLIGTKPKAITRTKKRPRATFPPLEATKRSDLSHRSEPVDPGTDGDDESSLDTRRIPPRDVLKPPTAAIDPGTDSDDEISLNARRITQVHQNPPPTAPIDLGTDGDDESSVDTTALLRRMQQRSVPVREETDESSCDTNSSLLQQKIRITPRPRKEGTGSATNNGQQTTNPIADENQPPPSHVAHKEPEVQTWDDELSVLDDGDNGSENTEELTRRMRGLPAKDPGAQAEQQQPPIHEFVLPDQPSSSSSEDETAPVPRDPPPSVAFQHQTTAPAHTTMATRTEPSLAPAQALPPSNIVNPYLQSSRVSTHQHNPHSTAKPVGQDVARSHNIVFNPHAQPIRSNPPPQTSPPGVVHEGLRKPSPRFMSPSVNQNMIPNHSKPTNFDDDIHDSEDEDGAAFGFAPTVTAAIERRKRDSIASFVPNASDGFPPFQREPCTERRESVQYKMQRREGYHGDDDHRHPPNADWSHAQSPLQEPTGYQEHQEEDQQYDTQSFPTEMQHTNDFVMATYEGNSNFNEPQRLFQTLPSVQYDDVEQGGNARLQRNEGSYQNTLPPEGQRYHGQAPQQHDFRQEPQSWAQQNPPFRPYNAAMASQPPQYPPGPLHDELSDSLGQQDQPDFTLEPATHYEVDYTQFHATNVPAQQQRKPRIRDASKRAPRSRKGGWKRRKKKGGGGTAATKRRRPAQRGGARTAAHSAAAGDDPHLRNIGGAQISF